MRMASCCTNGLNFTEDDFIKKALKQDLDFLERFLGYSLEDRTVEYKDIEEVLYQMPVGYIDRFWEEMMGK